MWFHLEDGRNLLNFIQNDDETVLSPMRTKLPLAQGVQSSKDVNAEGFILDGVLLPLSVIHFFLLNPSLKYVPGEP